MPEGPPDASAPRPSGPPAPVGRFRPGAAWAVIALAVAAILALNAWSGTDAAAAAAFARDLMRQQVQLQYGMRGLAGSLPGGSAIPPAQSLEPIRDAFGRGPVAQRQRLAVVAGDLLGPAGALSILDETERAAAAHRHPLSPAEREVQQALRTLYGGGAGTHAPGDAARLPAETRDLIRQRLDWFGDLALAPEGSPDREAVLAPARRKALFLFVFMVLLVGSLGIGLAAALAYWLSALRGGPGFLLAPGTAPHGAYAETFAVWMVLFLVLSAGFGILAKAVAPGVPALVPVALAQVSSLSALLWPVRRGIPWATVRGDLGLFLSATPLRDALAGIACWFMALPLMAAALVATVLLTLLSGVLAGEPGPFAPPASPSHPIVGEVAGGDSWLLVLAVAAVLAPILEETFFRGALYRHLRDATGSRGRVASIAAAGLLSGFVFAVIHPQGWTAIPLLMSVAWPLVHAREWRGSLVAPVAAHAWHNALVTLVAATLFGA